MIRITFFSMTLPVFKLKCKDTEESRFVEVFF